MDILVAALSPPVMSMGPMPNLMPSPLGVTSSHSRPPGASALPNPLTGPPDSNWPSPYNPPMIPMPY